MYCIVALVVVDTNPLCLNLVVSPNLVPKFPGLGMELSCAAALADMTRDARPRISTDV